MKKTKLSIEKQRQLIRQQILKEGLFDKIRDRLKKPAAIARLQQFLRGSGEKRLAFDDITGFNDPSGNPANVLGALQADTQAQFASTIGSGGNEIGDFFENISENPMGKKVVDKIKEIFNRQGKNVINSNDIKNNSPFSDLLIGVSDDFRKLGMPKIGTARDSDIVIDSGSNTIDISNFYLVSLKSTSNINQAGAPRFYDPIGNSKIKPQTIFQLIDVILLTYSNDISNAGIDTSSPVNVKYRIGVMGLSPGLLVNQAFSADGLSDPIDLSRRKQLDQKEKYVDMISNSIVAGQVFCKFINSTLDLTGYVYPTKNPSKDIAIEKLYKHVSTPVINVLQPRLNEYHRTFINEVVRLLEDHDNVDTDSVTVNRSVLNYTVLGKYSIDAFKTIIETARSAAIAHIINAHYSNSSSEFKGIMEAFLSGYISNAELKRNVTVSPTGNLGGPVTVNITPASAVDYISRYFAVASAQTKPAIAGTISSTYGVSNFLGALYAYSASDDDERDTNTPVSGSVLADVSFYLSFGPLDRFIGLGNPKNIGAAVAAFLNPYVLPANRTAILADIASFITTNEAQMPNPEIEGSHSELNVPLRRLSSSLEELIKVSAETVMSSVYGSGVAGQNKKEARAKTVQIAEAIDVLVTAIKNGKLDEYNKTDIKEDIRSGVESFINTGKLINHVIRFLFKLKDDITSGKIEPNDYTQLIQMITSNISSESIATGLNNLVSNLVNTIKNISTNYLEVNANIGSNKLYESILLDLMEASAKKQRAASQPKKLKLTKRQLQELMRRQLK